MTPDLIQVHISEMFIFWHMICHEDCSKMMQWQPVGFLPAKIGAANTNSNWIQLVRSCSLGRNDMKNGLKRNQRVLTKKVSLQGVELTIV